MDNEKEIINGCRKQDARFQKIVYEKYYSLMLGICLRYSNGREQAEDLVQDGFIKIFSKINQFRGDGTFSGWMCRIITNHCIDTLKKKIHSVNIEEIDLPDDIEVDIKFFEQFESAEIIETFHELPTGYRTVINLYAIEGYSHETIAKVLNISVNTSKTQLHKARKKLKTILTEKFKRKIGEI